MFACERAGKSRADVSGLVASGMTPVSSRTIRYARAWLAGPGECAEDEIVLDRDGTDVPATLRRPRHARGRLPAWVVMHGITRPGRAHEQLVRFTRSVTAAGLATIVPEVPEWRELRLAPHLSSPTVAAAIRGLRESGVIRDDPVGVIGFSFGAPHAISTGSPSALSDEVAGVAGFGGYCSLESTFRFMMTGRHEWDGTEHYLRPDPYGRWIAAANYLTAIPGYEDATDVADALRHLASAAGDARTASWDPVHDRTIAELRAGVSEARRDLFDVLAPPSGVSDIPAPDGGREARARSREASGLAEGVAEDFAEHLAEDLAAAARRIDPLIDPADALASVTRPANILHGRRDHLVPFTEAYRLRDALRGAQPRLNVTRLFGHSAQDPFPFAAALTEVPRFVGAIDGLLRMI
jgi:predicted esterase